MKAEKKPSVAVMLLGCMLIVGTILLTETYGRDLFEALSLGNKIVGTDIEGRWVMFSGFILLLGGFFSFLFSGNHDQ